MNLKALYDQQRETDATIEQKHPVMQEEENRIQDKGLALLVELGELANEVRCFKFWSNKPASAKEVILEEYVDGLHFILGLGNDCGYEDTEPLTFLYKGDKTTLTGAFNFLFVTTARFIDIQTKYRYERMFDAFLGVGYLLGFTWEEIETAYWAKNKINYERQKNGY